MLWYSASASIVKVRLQFLITPVYILPLLGSDGGNGLCGAGGRPGVVPGGHGVRDRAVDVTGGRRSKEGGDIPRDEKTCYGEQDKYERSLDASKHTLRRSDERNCGGKRVQE